MAQLIQAVQNALASYNANDLVRVHALLHAVYRCVLQSNGDNSYKVPHTGVTKRKIQGGEVVDRVVPAALVAHARNFLGM